MRCALTERSKILFCLYSFCLNLGSLTVVD